MFSHDRMWVRECSGRERGFGGGGPFGGRHDFRGGRFGGGGGRRRVFTGDELKLVLLKLISDQPRHGYDLIREIETLSGEGYAPSPGMVYPTLTMLADMELIAEQAEEGAPGGSRKLFAITEQGTAHLRENDAMVSDALDRLATLSRIASRTEATAVRRAMENLKMALRSRLLKEGADEQTIFDIAAIIDEAATKIERLK